MLGWINSSFSVKLDLDPGNSALSGLVLVDWRRREDHVDDDDGVSSRVFGARKTNLVTFEDRDEKSLPVIMTLPQPDAQWPSEAI